MASPRKKATDKKAASAAAGAAAPNADSVETMAPDSPPAVPDDNASPSDSTKDAGDDAAAETEEDAAADSIDGRHGRASIDFEQPSDTDADGIVDVDDDDDEGEDDAEDDDDDDDDEYDDDENDGDEDSNDDQGDDDNEGDDDVDSDDDDVDDENDEGRDTGLMAASVVGDAGDAGGGADGDAERDAGEDSDEHAEGEADADSDGGGDGGLPRFRLMPKAGCEGAGEAPDSCVACLFCGCGDAPESCVACLFGAESADGPSAGDAADAESGQTHGEDGLSLEGIVEAILIAATGPLTAKAIQKMTQRKVRPEAVDEAIAALNAFYAEQGRAFEVVKVNSAYQIMTLPAYAAILNPGRQTEPDAKKLSPAMLDTLAIIAYRQPLMRVDIEEIRGVACGPALRSLIEYGLVKVAGRRTDIPGQPMLYGTTERFLEVFGLGELDNLPPIDHIPGLTLG